MYEKGQTYIEIILAIGVFGVIIGGFAILGAGSFVSEQQSGEVTEATLYTQEAAEAVRAISLEQWNDLASRDDGGTHGLDNSGGSWAFSGTSNSDGIYTRTVDVNTVTRDGSGDIAAGNSDIETKEVIVTTSWTGRFGNAQTVTQTFNLTNWNRVFWDEDLTAEFADGIFSNTETTTTDDGEVQLTSISGGGATYTSNWDLSNAADYTFNGSDVEVSGGVASLVGSAGGLITGSTTDPGFDTGVPWTNGDWNENGPENHFTTRYDAGLGNPTWWVYHYFSSGAGDRDFGGYWEQAFTTTEDDPDVTIDLDYLTWFNTFTAADDWNLYAWVESSSGPPASTASAVWTESTGLPWYTWNSATTFDDDNNVTTAGTYYLKIGAYLDKNRGSSRYGWVGFDNVELNWEKSTTPTYPSTSPSIEADVSWEPDNKVISWSSFTETATKNGGEIYYQLSTDGGSTWQYWDGGSWVAAGASDYSTASVVNSNIGSLDASSGQVTIRAFLESDGTHDIELDDIEIQAEIEEITFETGTATTDETWFTVNTSNTYTDPVVVATYKEHTATPNNDTYSVSARVRNAGATSFEVRIEDPSGANLNPADIAYIVMEQGDWVMGSTNVEAYKENISTVASNSSWVGDNKSYTHTYSSGPVVLHQVMSADDSAWIESWVSQQGDRRDPPDTTGFQIAMNSAEVTASDSHGAETLGWIVFESGQNDTIDSTDFRTRVTGDNIRGQANGCFTQSFGTTYSSPNVIGSQMAMDGGDGGWLVECSLSTTQVGYHIDEDQENDSDRSHTTEQAGYVVFDGDVSVNGKAASGFQLSGTYQSSNFGTGANFNVIKWTENIPANTDLQIQIRTAPDVAGSPGTWSATWSGPDGEDGDETDFFTDPSGELIHPDHVGDEWIQYRATFTGDGTATAVLEDIRFIYAP